MSRGWGVTVVDSGITGALSRVPSGVELVARDIGSITPSEWDEIITDGATVFHLAAHKHNTTGVSPGELTEANVAATWNLACASARKRVRRLVFTSSLYAHGGLGPRDLSEDDEATPLTLYGVSKLAGEKIMQAVGSSEGLDWNCARLFFTYGPGQFAEGGYKSVIVKSFEALRHGRPLVVNGTGEQVLDYIYVSDVVAALIDLAETPRTASIVNVCSGAGYSINQLLEMIKDAAGKKSVEVMVAPPDWTDGTRRVGSRQLADATFASRPRVSIQEGLAAVWKGEAVVG